VQRARRGGAAPDGGAGDDAGSSGAEGDAGGSGKEAGPGCVAEILNQGTAAASVARAGVTGGAPWQSPGSALAADMVPARAELGGGDETERLVVTSFGFMPPPNMRIAGVEVELKRQAPGADVVDGEIVLVLGDQASPHYYYMTTAWPQSIYGTHIYGDVDDLWGMMLSPSDVTRTDFGVSLCAKRAPGATGAPVALVDSLRMTVTYCPN
jgi:hypothetical protein